LALNDASFDDIFGARRTRKVRTTVTIDDDLLESARELSGISEVPTLVRLALRHYVEREAARQLALMGGSQPGLEAPPRRRPPDFVNHPIKSSPRRDAAE
jgi:Arc/MetJ family transcription regulator